MLSVTYWDLCLTQESGSINIASEPWSVLIATLRLVPSMGILGCVEYRGQRMHVKGFYFGLKLGGWGMDRHANPIQSKYSTESMLEHGVWGIWLVTDPHLSSVRLRVS